MISHESRFYAKINYVIDVCQKVDDLRRRCEALQSIKDQVGEQSLLARHKRNEALNCVPFDFEALDDAMARENIIQLRHSAVFEALDELAGKLELLASEKARLCSYLTDNQRSVLKSKNVNVQETDTTH